MYSEQTMDIMIDTTIREIFLSSKEDCSIQLNNFSFKNKGHLAILSISGIAHDIFGFGVEIETGFFSYWFNNFKYKYRKFCKRSKANKKGINVENFIKEIEEKNEKPGIFSAIYNSYYERH